MAKLIGLSGKAAAALVGTVVAVGGGSYLVKDDQGTPVIQSLLSSGNQNEAPKVEAEDTQEQVASLPDSNSPTSNNEEKPEGIEIADEEPKAQTPNLPSFDVMRVERDGSVVIAGKAPKNSEIEIVEGDKVLGSAKSTADGDFAIVFDTPLSVGDHELMIKATPEQGEAVFSEEVGIVTIPKFENNQEEVLALVQKSGEASRILQGPSVASAAQAENVEEIALLETGKVDDSSPVVEAETPTESQDAKQPASASEETVNENASVEPTDGSTEPVAESDEQPVLVQAIDVEPNKVFIAGQGEPNRNARLYIDGKFKGNVKMSPQGTFLFELNEDLKPGMHDLRIDLLAEGSAEVASRAAVTIDHAPEPVAVASAETGQGSNVEQEEQTAETPIADAPAQDLVEAEPQSDQTEEGETVEVKEQVAQVTVGSETGTATDLTANLKEEVAQVNATEPAADEEEVETQKTETAAVVESEASNEQIELAEAKPVIQTGRSVIIRRGDNLWRISRRMLGAGRKYTLIFSANTSQIKDPNRIYPGQVFDVPDEEVAEGAEKKAG